MENAEIRAILQQGSKEWKQKRLGKVTASRVKDVMAKGAKGQYLKVRQDYLWEVTMGRFGFMNDDQFVTKAMKHGNDTEPFARAMYEQRNNVFATEIDFINHPFVKNFGCSPDACIERNICEIKCPMPETHFTWILEDIVPEEHLLQMHAQMACRTDAEWNDFFSFFKPMGEDSLPVPEGMQIFQKRLMRDNQKIAEIEFEVTKFNMEVDEMVLKIKSKIGLK